MKANSDWSDSINGINSWPTTMTFLGIIPLVFLLTSHFTQDCLENLFSTVRSKNPIPIALGFLRSLRLITVAQFSKSSKFGSYEVDDGNIALQISWI